MVGMSTKTAAARFDVIPPDVSIIAQDDEAPFASATYLAVGDYELNLDGLRHLTDANQIIPTGNALGPGHIVSFSTRMRGNTGTGRRVRGLGVIRARITDEAGVPVDDALFVIAQIINL
jgi:hypothetical protein